MPPGISLWHSLLVRHAKGVKAALERASQALDAQLTKVGGQPQTILVRNTPKQPLHPLARIRQSQSSWYSTARESLHQSVRNFSTSTSKRAGQRGYDKASLPKSRIGASINSSSGRAPFASTLRPNLTGGALGRTAGGYALGGSGRVGGARFFSHGPAGQAQVVHNVSQGVRAFFLGGQKAQFDGYSARFGGEKRYRAVSAVQDDAERKIRSVPVATPGSTLRYAINPTITALQPLDGVVGFEYSQVERADHLNSAGVLDALSVDFSRALKDLAAVLNDLKRLSALGNLPITTDGVTLQVHFPGCDAETVERLCAELGVLRGTVVQDKEFDAFVGTEIALLFPFAPSEEGSECGSSMFEPAVPQRSAWEHRHVIRLDDMLASEEERSSPAFSTLSDGGLQDDSFHDVREDVEDVLLNKCTSWSASDYESVSLRSSSRSADANRHDPLEYQGFEGIYRFLEELEAVRR